MRHRNAFSAVEAVSPNLLTAWQGPVRQALKAEFTVTEFRENLEPLRLIGVVSGALVFVSPSISGRDWVMRLAAHRLDELMTLHAGCEGGVRVAAIQDLPEELRSTVQPGETVTLFREPEAKADPAAAGLPAGGQGSTFENFCVGASNRSAYTVCKAIAAGGASAFSLVLLHGPPGVGKTHLQQAVVAEAVRLNPNRRVRYLMSATFIQEFQDCLQKKKDMSAFKALVRENDLFVLDDCHRIAGKRATEEEFMDTVRLVQSLGGQVLISADHGPEGLDQFDERVRATLRGATDCRLGEPDYDLRRRIAESRLQAYRAEEPDFTLSDAVLDLVACRVTRSGREVDGAIRQLLMEWLTDRAEITLPAAEAALKHKFGGPEKRVTVDHVIKTVAKCNNMSAAELLDRTRRQDVARPRQVAMYLATKLTTRSLPDLGRRFGGFDHTTVLYAKRRVPKLMAKDATFAAEVEAAEAAVRDSL
jgi:chromosomal replication initiator protein